MELQNFIQNTLVSLVNGIKEANKSLIEKNSGFELDVGKDGEIIFDIAITVSEEAKKSGGARINVYAISAGGDKGKVNAQENVSRIKFKICPKNIIS